MSPPRLSMLAANRFNRFHLAFGIGYDFLTRVTDAYFLFAYPFLLRVPGYNVRVPQLADAERDSNRSEEHTSELQSHLNLVCRLLLEKKKKQSVWRVATELLCC